MGWGNCGINRTTGQRMGYNFECKCHKRGCSEEINRGLGHVCGGMHEGGVLGCGYYFCSGHMEGSGRDETGRSVSLCLRCYEDYVEALEPEERAQEVGEDWKRETRRRFPMTPPPYTKEEEA